jgi:hypothetical protein
MSARYSKLFTWSLFATWVILPALTLSGQELKTGTGETYELRLETPYKVTLARMGKWFVGYLDENGDFSIVETISGGISLPFYLPPIYNYPAKNVDEAVYEYRRSGLLIKGTLDGDGYFVPEAGSKVITLKEYLQEYDPKKSLRIYNLPGRIVKRRVPDLSPFKN